MSLWTIKSAPRMWRNSQERVSDADLRAQDEHIDTDEEQAWDWRWAPVLMAAFESKLGKDMEDFIVNVLDEEEEETDRWRCETIENEMRAAGVEEWLRRNPVIFSVHEDDGTISFYTWRHAVGVAYHVFGVRRLRAILGVPYTSRHVPIEREAAWTTDPGWSAHVWDGDAIRFEEGCSLRGAAVKTAFQAMIGDLDGYRSPDDTSALLKSAVHWNEFHREEWLNADGEDMTLARAAKRAAMLDSAVEDVLEFLRSAEAIGLGFVAGKGAWKFNGGCAAAERDDNGA
jgi:hypothetical protein